MEESTQTTGQIHTEAAEKGESSRKTVVPRRKKFMFHLTGGRGWAHVHATYNNTIVSVTDQRGNVIVWSSSGKCGFKGAKKSTPYAAGVIVRSIADAVKNAGIREVDVTIRGVGPGREASVRAFIQSGIQVVSIKDITAVAHNGPRRPKPRRI